MVVFTENELRAWEKRKKRLIEKFHPIKTLIKRLWIIGFVAAALMLLCRPVAVSAQTPAPANSLVIYLFWGEGCPHCAKAKPFYENLANMYPEIELRSYEIYYDEENQKLFLQMAEEYGLEHLAVPTIFIGPYLVQGYSEEQNDAIESTVAYCLQNGCADAGLFLTEESSTPTAVVSTRVSPASITPTAIPSSVAETPDTTTAITIPLIGKVQLESKTAFVSTALIALVDGFNPCSLWVLTMLLAITLHTGSRKKVFLIGAIFLFVSALIYGLFIAGLFSVLKITSFMGWIRVLVALISFFFAVINIKDYFWFKQGLSLTIADEKKPGIFQKMRAVIDASNSLWGMIGATIVLAAGVSLVEFSCTAGFPVIWTNLLNAQNISGGMFVLLLIIYLLIYQFDEGVIFVTAVATLKTSRFEEKHGRALKLFSGLLMLCLSLVMIFKPDLMNDLGSSLLIFGGAMASSLLILVIHRWLLPKLGIKSANRSRRNDIEDLED